MGRFLCSVELGRVCWISFSYNRERTRRFPYCYRAGGLSRDCYKNENSPVFQAGEVSNLDLVI